MRPVIGVLLFAGGYALRNAIDKKVAPQSDFQANSEKYPLLSRRIFVENPNDPIIDFEPLRQSLRDYYEKNKLSGSVYFE